MQFDSKLILQIFFLIVLVAVNAFFSSSEIAIISLNDNKIRRMAEKGNRKAELLLLLVSEPSKFLATIQVGITLSGLLASAFAAESFADRLTITAQRIGIPIDPGILKLASLIIITTFLSYFTLVFGELVPKRLALQKPEQISMLAIKPLNLLSKITGPFIKFLTFSTNFTIKIFGGNPAANEEGITEEEIRMMVDVGQEKGAILGSEKEMINNIFEFNNTLVSEIMTHRTDIIAISIDAGFNNVIEVAVNEKFTRVPVYDEVIDNIVGILHVKDILQSFEKNKNEEFSLRNMIRQPYYVPGSIKTDQLFRELKKNKNHMAVVIDEYGGTAGIVTIEDLLEEIVGNIFDEYDEDENEIEKLDENTYVMSGTVELDSVADFLKANLPVDDYETLSGFLIGELGRIPEEYEKPVIEYDGFVFKVEDIEEKRIGRIKVCRSF